MYLKEIHVENFRLLKDVNVILDPNLTLIVGKNNTGKTSFANLIKKVISEEKSISINDYPLECRDDLYKTIEDYWSGKIREEKEIKERISEPRISFYIDYSEEDESQLLGALSPFIIDIDESITSARIDAIYTFDASSAGELFGQCKTKYDQLIKAHGSKETKDDKLVSFDRSLVSTAIKSCFDKFFSLRVWAVNPNNPEDYQERPSSALKKLFIYRTVEAERNLDESENNNEHPLIGIMKRVFNPDEEELTGLLSPKINELNSYIDDASIIAQERINVLMDSIIKGMIHFGYPSAEDLELKANTDISLKQQILSNTDLLYTSAHDKESLPSTHNGLGYKNLIKMSLIFTDFSRQVKADPTAIPLLFIEEPEAHMHPQLQTAFVKYLNKFLKDAIGENRRFQTVLSSHSAHITNTVDFKQVRYMRRLRNQVICKDLQSFYQNAQIDEQEENYDFLQKYFKLSYCDLYFCDKAIIVEGAAERLLLPKMIIKCAESGAFGDTSPSLQSQYCAIIEVGGAYAHRFYDFLDYLEIPTLILTDIDFVDSNNKKCQRDKATHSSNGAINRWCHDVFKIAVTQGIPIEKIIELSKDKEKKTNAHRHLEFQMEENNTYPRSLEESIININRDLFGVDKDDTEIPIFDETGEKKTDFAIKLLTNPEYADFEIPSYIREGLMWLNDQAKMPEREIPVRQHKRLIAKKVRWKPCQIRQTTKEQKRLQTE